MRFEATREPYGGSTNPASAGNGSIVRLAPVPLRWGQNGPSLPPLRMTEFA
jgi:ADP-ribosyl-[dinitrogen reductase] hydrolase